MVACLPLTVLERGHDRFDPLLHGCQDRRKVDLRRRLIKMLRQRAELLGDALDRTVRGFGAAGKSFDPLRQKFHPLGKLSAVEGLRLPDLLGELGKARFDPLQWRRYRFRLVATGPTRGRATIRPTGLRSFPWHCREIHDRSVREPRRRASGFRPEVHRWIVIGAGRQRTCRLSPSAPEGPPASPNWRRAIRHRDSSGARSSTSAGRNYPTGWRSPAASPRAPARRLPASSPPFRGEAYRCPVIRRSMTGRRRPCSGATVRSAHPGHAPLPDRRAMSRDAGAGSGIPR